MLIMPTPHEWFVHTENLRDFQRKLESETDPDRRRVLQKLIAEERSRKLPPKPAASQTPKVRN
jgi:hypothetical protein